MLYYVSIILIFYLDYDAICRFNPPPSSVGRVKASLATCKVNRSRIGGEKFSKVFHFFKKVL